MTTVERHSAHRQHALRFTILTYASSVTRSYVKGALTLLIVAVAKKDTKFVVIAESHRSVQTAASRRSIVIAAGLSNGVQYAMTHSAFTVMGLEVVTSASKSAVARLSAVYSSIIAGHRLVTKVCAAFANSSSIATAVMKSFASPMTASLIVASAKCATAEAAGT